MGKSSATSNKRGKATPRGADSAVEGKPGAARSASAIARSQSVGSYAEAVEYLYDRVDLERTRQDASTRHQYKLDRMRAILQALENPQDGVRHVHVAGTKGKGSTCEMTATCLEGCGYTVGLYTSPHLTDVKERIRLNRKPIGEADFTRLMSQCARAAASVQKAHGEATFFEIMTALGFLHFAEQAVDVAVIEVGLGGLLDCTNVITPEVAAVAMIGLDHTQILGSTVEEIAAQKAGIFKPGVPALTFDQPAPILRVLRQTAEQVGAPLQVVGKDIEFSHRAEASPTGQTVRCTLTTERNHYEHIRVPLRGEHQAHNCGLSLAILDQLTARGFACPAKRVTRGMEMVTLPGRFELTNTTPRILLDGAHNAESIAALVKSIGANLRYDSLVVVFGCAADKDSGAIIRNLSMGADKVIFTRASGNARAADPHDLGKKYHEIAGRHAQLSRGLPEALGLAVRAAGRDDLVCVTGSFYLVGEAKAWLSERAAAKKR